MRDSFHVWEGFCFRRLRAVCRRQGVSAGFGGVYRLRSGPGLPCMSRRNGYV